MRTSGQVKKNFSSILREEATNLFFDRFSRKVQIELRKNFGDKITEDIILALSKKILSISSPETFLFASFNINDQALEIYKKHKSLDEFLANSFLEYKLRAEKGETGVIVKELFIVLAYLLKDDYSNENYVKTYLTNLLYLMGNATHSSPFSFYIYEYRMMRKLAEYTNISTIKYSKIITIFFKEYFRILHEAKFHLPKINIIFGLSLKNKRVDQIDLLRKALAVQGLIPLNLCENIPSLSEDTPELREFIDNVFKKHGKLSEYNFNSILLQLKAIEKDDRYIESDSTSLFINERLHSFEIESKIIPSINKIYTSEELIETQIKPYASEVILDYALINPNKLEHYIDMAKKLNLVKVSNSSYENLGPISFANTTLKIKIINVNDKSESFIRFIKSKTNQIKSELNRDFIIEINYDENCIVRSKDNKKAKYIRVISDIHADYNRRNNYSFNFGDDFVINCGDTAGDAKTCIAWNRNHIRKGVVVTGNHLGYSPAFPELGENEKNTKGYQIHVEASQLKSDMLGPVLLSNTVKPFNDNIVILGTCLYTDFALYGKNSIVESMNYAQRGMNDFRYITVIGHRIYEETSDGWEVTKIKREEATIRKFTPQDHAYYFTFSYKFLKENLQKYRDKKVIVVTHHAPSTYSISPQFAGSPLNPAFASNLNSFIIDNPNIRLWCHGHVHSSFDYILGNTRVVCEPFGYDNENNADLPFNYGKRISVKDIESDTKWTSILKEEIKKGKIQVYEN